MSNDSGLTLDESEELTYVARGADETTSYYPVELSGPLLDSFSGNKTKSS